MKKQYNFNDKEIKEKEKEIVEEAKYMTAASTGKKPSDVVVEIKRTKGRPTGGLRKLTGAAGGKKSRGTNGKKYTPTDDDYSKVEEMVTVGLDQHTISKIMGISNATLTKYYKHTLETARENRTARVAGVAYEMAMSGDSASMTTFWLKTQGGWTPKQHIVHEDRNFDISWSDDEDDIADANRREEVNIH
jgi:hypothetical protein